MNLFLMFSFLVSSDLATKRFDLFTWLIITIELTLTCFFTYNILVITLVDNAVTFLVEYSDRKVSPVTKNDCYSWHLLKLIQITWIFYFLFYFNLFLFMYLRYYLLLPTQHALHVRKVKIIWSKLVSFKEFLVFCLFVFLVVEVSFLKVQTRVDNRSVDEQDIVVFLVFKKEVVVFLYEFIRFNLFHKLFITLVHKYPILLFNISQWYVKYPHFYYEVRVSFDELNCLRTLCLLVLQLIHLVQSPHIVLFIILILFIIDRSHPHLLVHLT